MFKRLLLGLLASAALLQAAPAEAGRCWYLDYGEHKYSEYCPVSRRINYNGHIVWDIIDGDGKKFTVILWDDDIAEVVGLSTRPMQMPYKEDADGAIRLYWDDGSNFIFHPYK